MYSFISWGGKLVKLNSKTLEKLRELINEETTYRSGSKLVEFFNKFGFEDEYGQGFPPRWQYTDERLNSINGTPSIEKCIVTLLAPINYIDRESELNNHIKTFNKYLDFDGFKLINTGREITIIEKWYSDAEDNGTENIKTKEISFLNIHFPEISFAKIKTDEEIKPILEQRFVEAESNLENDSPLSSIFLCGSILEGLLLSLATSSPQKFNSAVSSIKDKDGKVKKYSEWSLSDFINTAYEIGYINEDVKEFSHILRDYRNFIHPCHQLKKNFYPDKHTAKICFQVLNAACAQIIDFQSQQ